IGAGLAGSLAALALARRGLAVRLVAPQGKGAAAPATALSYGGMAGGRAARAWRRLERRHGPLGLRRSGLVLHGWPGPLGALPPAALAWLTAPLPFFRVDAPTLCAALPDGLRAAGVERVSATVTALERAAGGWRLHGAESGGGGQAADGGMAARQVVLAAGAGCRALWPALPERLRVSWAGVLTLAEVPPGPAWLEPVRRGRIVQPRNWRRPALERSARAREEGDWIVDAGLAPWGEGVVLGQISRIPAPGEAGSPPDPAWMEERLREGLAELEPALGALEAPYRQVPVTFCSDGRPLLGPVEEAPGLWIFTGFSGAFALVPEAAERLATAVAAAAPQNPQKGRRRRPPGAGSSVSGAPAAVSAEGQSASQ
ncbi:MAG: FAD-dependent oxidoreductase, partial [Synechococcaceae cyanobacterium]|nr:FAD-dependent oxidoreductase [Synechococcaceae cyanobacterium]